MLKFNQHKKLTKENLFATMNIVSQKPTFVNQLYSILVEILFLPPFAVLVSPEPPSTVGVNDTMVLLNPL